MKLIDVLTSVNLPPGESIANIGVEYIEGDSAGIELLANCFHLGDKDSDEEHLLFVESAAGSAADPCQLVIDTTQEIVIKNNDSIEAISIEGNYILLKFYRLTCIRLAAENPTDL